MADGPSWVPFRAQKMKAVGRGSGCTANHARSRDALVSPKGATPSF